VAAILRGRRTLLIESDPQWATLGAERLKAADEVMDRAERI
jgi:hypothetical protein